MSTLLVKSFAGLVFLLLFLAAILFVSAGSLAFWQAWLYLAVFGLCTVLITLYLVKYDQKLLASRVQAGPVAETQASQKVIQSLASLFFIALFIVAGLDFRYHWSAVPALLSVVAAAFVALGFFVVFLVFRANSYTSGVIEVAAGQPVISTGPYALVRHPMYSGAAVLLLFTALTLGSWFGILFALPIIVVVAVRAVAEEKFLRVNLSGYDAYTQKVRYRLIPFVW